MSVSLNDDVLIHVEGISKIFCRDLKKSLWYGLQDCAKDMLSWRSHRPSPERGSVSPANPAYAIRPLRTGEFHAVKDVRFELRRGECLGLIGHNGAGKTTLLKMLNGLIKPDTGWIEMRGRVGAVIALGAGFNPVLTGRENIQINASILGLKAKEINEQMEEILAFAELEEFADMPVQSFSSGMRVRLGFAIATAIKPDVLLLDEVLAVGDSRFRQKCLNRINDIRASCATIFVSHHESEVRRIASTCLLLRRGEMVAKGDVPEVFTRYQALAYESREEIEMMDFASSVKITNLAVDEKIITFGGRLGLVAFIASQCTEELCNVRLVILDSTSNGVAEWHSSTRNLSYKLIAGKQEVQFEINNLRLRPGQYQVALEVTSPDGRILAKVRSGPNFAVQGNLSSTLQHNVQL